MEQSASFLTGQPATVAASIARSIAAFERNYKHVKIGITGRPVQRAAEHTSAGWKRLVLKYKTSSARNANAIEKYFIEQRPELKNKWTGYSYMTETGPYYVYMIMK